MTPSSVDNTWLQAASRDDALKKDEE